MIISPPSIIDRLANQVVTPLRTFFPIIVFVREEILITKGGGGGEAEGDEGSNQRSR